MPSGMIDVGSTVLISRSDGRIHSAIVDNVKENKGTVIVKWEEQGVCKGKHMSIGEITDLNEIRKASGSSQRLAEKNDNVRPETRDVYPKENSSKLDTRAPHRTKRHKWRYSTSGESSDWDRRSQSEDSFESCGTDNHQKYHKPKMCKVPAISKAKLQRQEEVRQVPQRSRPRTMASEAAKPAPMVPLRPPPSTTHRRPAPHVPSRTSDRPQTTQKEDQVVTFVRQLDLQRAEKRLHYDTVRADLAYRKSQSKHWDILQKIEHFKTSVEFKTLQKCEPARSDCKIMVCIRKRPLSEKEIARDEVDIMTVPNTEHIIAHELRRRVDSTTKLKNHPYRFDYVFDESCSNEQVYEQTARPLVDALFRGGKATCFAYGQTGSGKTYTMGGTANNQNQMGIYGFVVRDVFEMWKAQRSYDPEIFMVASYYEIYGTKIYDLLEKKAQLSIMEDRHGNVRVVKLSERIVDDAEQVMKLIQLGNRTRTSGKTSANDNSSRSHAIFQLVFRSRGNARDAGKLSLIDLAGNERGTDNTSTEKKSRKETGEINKALLVLKECIRAMSLNNTHHLPFRGSKLTHVLRDSFIGSHTKTCMIATVSPGIHSLDHSCDTLRYANRVKGLKVKVPALLEGQGSFED